jgi:uncharacterized Zn-binding protein involved in type VI secretion
MTAELYSLENDFMGSVDVQQLRLEIASSIPRVRYISIYGDTVKIVFNLPVLTTGEKSTLDTIIASHMPSEAIDPDEQLATVQARKTTQLTGLSSYTSILFDIKDIENNGDVINFTGGDSEINIAESGTYMIKYLLFVSTDRTDARVVRNGSTLIAGSECYCIPTGINVLPLVNSVMVSLNTGDTVELQLLHTGASTTVNDILFTVVRQAAISGADGAVGATGAQGPEGPQGPQGPAGAGSGDILGPGATTLADEIALWSDNTGTVLKRTGSTISSTGLFTTSSIASSLFNFEESTEGSAGHLRIQMKNDWSSDPYNFGVDNSITNRLMIESISGNERQAVLLGCDSPNTLDPIFGVSTTNDSVNWTPKFIVTQNGKIGIGTSTPIESLDVVGNVVISGTINGRDIAADGTKLDNSIVLNSYNKTSDPTISDDSSLGYVIGSQWFNDTTDTMWVCVDDTDDSAMWRPITYSTTDEITEGANLYFTDARADARITLQAGVANGLATLDATGKVLASQLNFTGSSYLGTWNADTNSPTISSGGGGVGSGDYYIVSVAGNTNIDGVNNWIIGDTIVFNGTAWEKIATSSSVASVAGKSGVVTLVANDITDLSTATVPEDPTTLYYTDARVDTRIATKRGTANGLASLNGAGQVPTDEINLANIFNYVGDWNANINSPTLSNGSGVSGEVYKVSTDGTTLIDGVNEWKVGDLIYATTGGTWNRLANGGDGGEINLVTSVAGRIGDVVITTTDLADFNSEVDTRADARIVLQAGAVNGLAGLDANALLPQNQFNYSGVFNILGGWNANTNTPTITSGTGTSGEVYVITTAGSTNIDGVSVWNVNDWIYFDGTVWKKLAGSGISGADDVFSVAGKVGYVTLVPTDITGLSTATVPEDPTALYYTDARADARITLQAGVANGLATLDSGNLVPIDQLPQIDHGSLAGLTDDDHTQYALLSGRSGGQSFIGGINSGDDITIQSTSDNTRGVIILEDDILLGGEVDTKSVFILKLGATTASKVELGKLGASVEVKGDLLVGGTVDGRDVAGDGAQLDELYSTIGLSALTTAEVDQLENINTTTISGTQWGYLGNSNQGIATSDSVQFADITVDNTVINDSNITFLSQAEFKIIGSDINAFSITDGVTDFIKVDSNNGKVGIDGNAEISGNVDAKGNILVGGTVDGRDVAGDGAQLDELYSTIGLSALTTAEVDQLENINTTTISGTQWGYLGNSNQGIATSDSVQFADITVDNTVINDSNITFSSQAEFKIIGSDINAFSITDGVTDFIKVDSNNGKVGIEGAIEFDGIATTPTSGLVGSGLLYKKTGNDGLFWKPDGNGVEIDLTTGFQYSRTAIGVSQSPYTVSSTDEIIGIDTTGGEVVITLPEISTIGGTNNYKKFHIVDEGGNTSINNITVNPSGSNTINKRINLIIDADHTSITLYNDGVSNWVIL